MSTSYSGEEVNSLRSEVAELRLLVGALQLRLDRVERGINSSPTTRDEFELVSAPSGISPASLAAGVDLSAERVRAAEKVGQWLRRALRGEHRGSSGREQIDLASRVYLVCRDFDNQVYDPPKVFDTLARVKAICCVNQSFGDSVFIGLPSKTEARLAVIAAGLQVPAELTRSR